MAGTKAGAATVVKRTPIRTCVACRTTGGKRGLLRLVRLPEGGGVALDPTGKKSGRGAYVCPSETCVTQALKRKSLERSLKPPIPESVAEELRRTVVPDEPGSTGGPDG
jgi:uncharacterized protein